VVDIFMTSVYKDVVRSLEVTALGSTWVMY